MAVCGTTCWFPTSVRSAQFAERSSAAARLFRGAEKALSLYYLVLTLSASLLPLVSFIALHCIAYVALRSPILLIINHPAFASTQCSTWDFQNFRRHEWHNQWFLMATLHLCKYREHLLWLCVWYYSIGSNCQLKFSVSTQPGTVHRWPLLLLYTKNCKGFPICTLSDGLLYICERRLHISYCNLSWFFIYYYRIVQQHPQELMHGNCYAEQRRNQIAI